MNRIDQIFSYLTPCELLADVGCDHGYLAEMALKQGVAKKVIVSDISAPSLEKAKKLLYGFAQKGLVTAVVSNGFEKYLSTPDQAVIAGMGGEEIIKIISSAPFIVNRLVLQPMKNADKLRVFLVDNGYKIISDFVFKDGKFYDLIVCERGTDKLTCDEITFGRTNLSLRGKAFIERLEKEQKRIIKLLPDLNGVVKEENEKALSRITKMIKGN